MKKKYCYYGAFLLPAFVCWLAGCTDEFLPSPAVQTELKEFALEEAQEYFRSEAEKEGVRSRGESEVKALSPGDFVPDWDGAVGSSSNGLACYDVPIEADYRYKAVYAEERHGTVSAEQVSVYQKLIIVKDVKSDRMSQYILTLIPSKAYDARYGSSVCDRFITRSDKGGFSGVAVYSCVYSAYTARVDTYKDGVKREGVFLLDGTDRDVSDAKADYARSLVSSLQILRGRRPLSRGEYDGDYYVDYTYDDTYDEIYDGGWFDEIVVTPDPVWDGVGADGLTNDEWMSSTTPDSTVDPSPEDGTSNETDDVTTSDDGGNQPQAPEEPDVQLSGFNASELQKVKSAITSLQQRLPELKLDALKIEKGITVGYAGVNNGVILLSDKFFGPTDLSTKVGYAIPSPNDQVAILWHEIYHWQNNHNASTKLYGVSTFMPSYVPPEIEEKIKEELKEWVPGIDSVLLEECYKNEITIDSVKSIEFYINELETYGKEKELYPDSFVSDGYRMEREFKIWSYEQHIEAEKNNKTNGE